VLGNVRFQRDAGLFHLLPRFLRVLPDFVIVLLGHYAAHFPQSGNAMGRVKHSAVRCAISSSPDRKLRESGKL